MPPALGPEAMNWMLAGYHWLDRAQTPLRLPPHQADCHAPTAPAAVDSLSVGYSFWMLMIKSLAMALYLYTVCGSSNGPCDFFFPK